jgi:UDP-N-acetylglucosamine--N-acetylmuramyl-(pentapeptide) pyrophosphoryl-undecaprenol N-acetylglucosamine transferase
MIKTDGKTIVLTGGGTAGHVLPCVALLPYLKTKFDKIYYIGSTSTAERKIIEDAGLKFFALECVKFRRSLNPKSLLKNAFIPFGFIKSRAAAQKILRELSPDIVFSKGGFVALPVVRAAKALKIPVVAHESDATLGLANKLSVGACDKICTTFKIEGDKFVHTGSLIRQKIYKGQPGVVLSRHFEKGTESAKRNLLVMGGSLGARRINEAVSAALPELLKDYNIIHICGRNKAGVTSAPHNYIQLEFVNDIENYIAWADIVVSRAGSNTLCELLVNGKPTLFIPLSTGRGDQIDNANIVIKENAGAVLNEDKMDTDSFLSAIASVWDKREAYKTNSKCVVKDGTKAVFDTIYSVVCHA